MKLGELFRYWREIGLPLWAFPLAWFAHTQGVMIEKKEPHNEP